MANLALSKQQIANKIQKILQALYPQPAIPLKHENPYTLLIAVLLSAQCTDACVNLVTPALFSLADTAAKMCLVSVSTIQELIRPCGLSARKSQAIAQLSQILVDQYKGCVPASFEELEALPGVGHKTASVVMAQAFEQPAFPVDTHIHRCAQRWHLSSGKNVVQTEKDLKALFPRKRWNLLHLQIIYFARRYCPARTHDPLACPICSWCANCKLILSDLKNG